jgi:hypothetical protein
MKRHIDRIDIEAEREAHFVALHARTITKPWGYNKKTHANRAARRAADAWIECRTIPQHYSRSF